MKDINKLMPKLPPHTFGALMNFIPNHAERKQLLQILPFDSKWKMIFNEKDAIRIDGKTILKHNAERYT